MIEDDHSFTCPHCGSENFIRLDVTGGRKQVYTYDCEVCCRPIQIRVEYDADGNPDLSAESDV